MFHYSLRVIDEPKMSEIRILNLCQKKSILVDIYRQSLLSVLWDERRLGIRLRRARGLMGREEGKIASGNTAAKRLRMCQVEHFRSLFQSHFPVMQSLPRALGFILCAACGSVVLLHAACDFDYFVVIEIAFIDTQAQITETIIRLDSEKVR